MENSNELDKLLGGESGDNQSVTPTEPNEGSEIDKKIEAAVSKVTQGFKGRIDSLQTKLEEKDLRIAELEKTVQPLKPQQAEAPKEDWDTRDGIKNIIQKEATSAASKSTSDVEKIKGNIWDKSLKTLAKSHSIDFDSEEGKAKIALVKELAPKIGINNEFDQDDVLASQEKAWAAINYQQLNEQVKLAARMRVDSEINSNDLASSSISDSVREDSGDVEATKADWREYRVYQSTGGTMDIAKFLAYRRQLS